MLQDKRSELDSEKQKSLLTRLVEELSAADPDLYYQPTSAIALRIKAHIDGGGGLNADDRKLLEPLSQRDIEVLLSLH